MAPGQCSETPRSQLRRSGLSADFSGSIADGSTPACSTASAGVGDPSPVPIFVARHAPFRQHARRADSGQPPTGPRRRRTAESGSCCPRGVRRRRPAGSFSAVHRRLDADGLRRLGQAYLASLPALADGKTRITDKMPSNFLCRPDPPDPAQCPHHPHHARPGRYLRFVFLKTLCSGQAFSYDLAELGRYYRWYHELMAHWRSVLPAGAMLDVSYEDVVDNLEAASPAADRLLRPALGRSLPELPRNQPADRHRQQRSGPPAAVPQFAGALAALRGLPPAAARARKCRGRLHATTSK